jgi:hypothetical protein
MPIEPYDSRVLSYEIDSCKSLLTNRYPFVAQRKKRGGMKVEDIACPFAGLCTDGSQFIPHTLLTFHHNTNVEISNVIYINGNMVSLYPCLNQLKDLKLNL